MNLLPVVRKDAPASTDTHVDAVLGADRKKRKKKRAPDGVTARFLGTDNTSAMACALIPIMKGDVEGHAFHGNQWVAGSAGPRGSNRLLFHVSSSDLPIGTVLQPGGSGGRNARQGVKVSHDRVWMTDSAAKAYDFALLGMGAKHYVYLVRPEGAVSEGTGTNNFQGVTADRATVVEKFPLDYDKLRTQHALSEVKLAGPKVDGLLQTWRKSPEGEITDSAYMGPSAKLEEWRRKVERGVPFDKARFTKGDLLDHSFRGNQWTGGIGGDGKMATGKVIPDGFKFGPADWRSVEDPTERLTKMWQTSFNGMALVRDAMEAQLHGGQLTKKQILNKAGQSEIRRELLLAVHEHEKEYGKPYDEIDLAKDANASAKFILDGVTHAPPIKDPIYRGMMVPAETLAQMTQPGKRITFGPSSFSADAVEAAQYADVSPFNSVNRFKTGDKSVVLALDEGGAMQLPEVHGGWSEMHEWLAGGTFEVTSVDSTSKMFGADPQFDKPVVHLKQVNRTITSKTMLRKADALDLWDFLTEQDPRPRLGSTMTKGEAAGHEFRGNQWTGGKGGGLSGAAPTRNGGQAVHTADDARTALGYTPWKQGAKTQFMYRAVSQDDYKRIMSDPHATLDSNSKGDKDGYDRPGETYADIDPGAIPFDLAQREGRVIMKIDTHGDWQSRGGPGRYVLPSGLTRNDVVNAVTIAAPHGVDDSKQATSPLVQPMSSKLDGKQGIGVTDEWSAKGDTPEEKAHNAWVNRERYNADPIAAAAAKDYRQLHGLPEPDFGPEDLKDQRADLERARQIVAAAETHSKGAITPETRAAYKDLLAQTKAQAAEMKKHGIKVEYLNKQQIIDRGLDPKGLNPYPTAKAQRDDVQKNHRLMTASIVDYPESYHPILSSTQGGEYDQFRAVHDYFGHIAAGTGFDRHGEYEAWLHHMSMFYGPARQAASSELTLENSYLVSQGKSSPHFAYLLPTDVTSPYDEAGSYKGEGWERRLSYHAKALALLPVFKGDKPDHDFHGNQHTGGISGGDQADTPGLEAATPRNLSSLIKSAVENGGFSWHPHSGEAPTSGFQVGGVRPDTQIDFSDPTSEESRNQVADGIVKMLRANADLFKGDPNMYLGGWHDVEHHKFVIEPSQNISDRSSAILHGVDRNQQSVWDNSAFEEVNTHGSGNFIPAEQRHFKARSRSAPDGRYGRGASRLGASLGRHGGGRRLFGRGSARQPDHEAALILVVLKGDKLGHDFHGNQYTGGIGGHADETHQRPMLAVDGIKPRKKKDTLKAPPASPSRPIEGVGMTEFPPVFIERMNKKAAALGVSTESILHNFEHYFKLGKAKDGKWYHQLNGDIAKLSQKLGARPDVVGAAVSVMASHREWNKNLKDSTAIFNVVTENKPFTVSQKRIDDFSKHQMNGRIKHPERLLDGEGNPIKAGQMFPKTANPWLTVMAHPDIIKAKVIGQTGVDPPARVVALAQGTMKPEEAVQGVKLRSFYNNMVAPKDPRFATVDTWMFRAGVDPEQKFHTMWNGKEGDYTLAEYERIYQKEDKNGKPMFKPDGSPHALKRAPQNLFQASPGAIKVKGKTVFPSNVGLYPMFHEAINRGAKLHGMLPHEYQAVVWYAVKDHWVPADGGRNVDTKDYVED